MSYNNENYRDKISSDLIGQSFEPSDGGKPSIILDWKVHVSSEKNSCRLYKVGCVHCGNFVYRRIGDIKKSESHCRDCAQSIISDKLAGRTMSKRRRISIENDIKNDVLIGTQIDPQRGRATTIKSWFRNNGLFYRVVCVECGTECIKTMTQMKSNEVLCVHCLREKRKLDKLNEKKDYKQKWREGGIVDSCDVAFSAKPIVSKVTWKQYDDDEYQKMLDEMNKKLSQGGA